METKYKKFIQHCLDNDNLWGICSFEEYKKIDKQLKVDGII